MSDKYSKRRLASSTFTTIVSISLVLFMLGLVGMFILNAKKITDKVKENIGFQVVMKDDAKEVDVKRIQKTLDATDYVRSTELVSEEEAAQRLQDALGEDFIGFLGFNPLTPTIHVRLKAEYANNDSLAWIEKDLLANTEVKEMIYHKEMIRQVNENVKKISIVILVFSGLLMLIALVLINNTIRLAIYSKRFLIKTMQLVGATQGFIRRPFILTGIRHGIYGAIIAICALVGLLYYAQQQLPELLEIQDLQLLASLFGIVLLMGILISWISTSLAVTKYLRLRTDDLYY